MEYAWNELLFFLFIYSFLGWCLEVAYMAVVTGRFCNRGFFNMPFCLSYGVVMDMLVIVIPTLRRNYLMQFLAYLVIITVSMQLTEEVTSRLAGHHMWNRQLHFVVEGKIKREIFRIAGLILLAVISVNMIHPLVFLLSQMLPRLVLNISLGILSGLALVDFIVVMKIIRKKRINENAAELAERLQDQKQTIGNRITDLIFRRLHKAYPNLEELTLETQIVSDRSTFAKGVCLHKLLWVFFITALLGDLIETVFVYAKDGILMSRSSVLYGPFSVVWGIGAALLTLLLYRLADKEDRYIFIGGFLIGGTYEYMASLVLELVLGTTFWDYSDMPFNLHGRTNLLYCIFWGILGLVWIKVLYPIMSRWIEKIPPISGVIVTWVLVFLMVCDLAVSGLAIVRYVERKNGISADNAVERFLDYEYEDDVIEFVWPNLEIQV